MKIVDWTHPLIPRIAARVWLSLKDWMPVRPLQSPNNLAVLIGRSFTHDLIGSLDSDVCRLIFVL
jgi:hypothetical protein